MYKTQNIEERLLITFGNNETLETEKAPGADNISNELIKYAREIILDISLHLRNMERKINARMKQRSTDNNSQKNDPTGCDN